MGDQGNKAAWDALKKALGRPGIWCYVLEEHREEFMKAIDEAGDEVGTERKPYSTSFKDFEYRDEITQCDHCEKTFKDEDMMMPSGV